MVRRFLISRATDDLLVSASRTVYLKILANHETHAGWMHDTCFPFLGIGICELGMMEVHQAPYEREIVAASVSSRKDRRNSKTGAKHSISSSWNGIPRPRWLLKPFDVRL
jgi:hypothetical protein